LGSRSYLETQPEIRDPMGQRDQEKWQGFTEVAAAARALSTKLKREVYLHYRNIPDVARTDLLAKPIRLLKTDSHPSVVFTTNYDPAVEKFCASQNLRITDGFVNDEQAQEYIWDRSAFDDFSGSPEKSLVLFKLHGSASWHSENGRIIKGPPTYIVADPDYQNVMIYPATRKVAIFEPFFTAYDYLERCLDNAESCLVIGYSFRDYDTLMRFKSASLSNRRLKIAVLDQTLRRSARNLVHMESRLTRFPTPSAMKSPSTCP